MRRLDAMQPHRAGILRFLRDMRRDPSLAALLGPQLSLSMRWMLDAAEIEGNGGQRRIIALGLVGVWLATVRAWAEDESEDLGTTMAALDRALDRAEQIARTLRLLPAGAPEAPYRRDAVGVTDRLGLAVAPERRDRAMQSLLDDVTARLLERFRATAPPADGAAAKIARRRYPRTGVSALVSPINKTKGDVRDV